MSRSAALLLLTLAACADTDTGSLSPSGDMQGWRFSSGKVPTRAEYAAVVAACQGGAVQRLQGKPLDVCLADFGLRRAE